MIPPSFGMSSLPYLHCCHYLDPCGSQPWPQSVIGCWTPDACCADEFPLFLEIPLPGHAESLLRPFVERWSHNNTGEYSVHMVAHDADAFTAHREDILWVLRNWKSKAFPEPAKSGGL